MIFTFRDFEPGDVCLYATDAHPAFRTLAWMQQIAGIRNATIGHVGMVYRVSPRGEWIEEISAYTSPYPGRVELSRKYPYACDVLRFPELDTDKATKFLKDYVGQPYGYTALFWLGLWRKCGIKKLTLPEWTRWRHVCSPLVVGALRAGGVDPLPGLNTSLVMPADFKHVSGGRVIGQWVPGA